jgi:hypothetical protein
MRVSIYAGSLTIYLEKALLSLWTFWFTKVAEWQRPTENGPPPIYAFLGG